MLNIEDISDWPLVVLLLMTKKPYIEAICEVYHLFCKKDIYYTFVSDGNVAILIKNGWEEA